jgi:hypothetical protein
MPVETVTLQIPEMLYQRLVNTARATQRSLEEVMLHALQVGSPPEWDDVPEEFQADLAALDKLDDNTLWQIVHSRKTVAQMERYNTLLESNSSNTLTEAERFVLFKWKEDASPTAIAKTIEALQGLKGKIPGIVDLSCGENFSDRAKGFQHGLVVRFNSRDELAAYMPHPVHHLMIALTYIDKDSPWSSDRL